MCIRDSLEAIEARIAEIETAIQNTIDAISAIGDVAYTAESNGKIQAAEALFENLDKDIKDNDTAEEQDLIVTNYATLVAARAAYDKMHEQVETAVSAIVGLSLIHISLFQYKASYECFYNNINHPIDYMVRAYVANMMKLFLR